MERKCLAVVPSNPTSWETLTGHVCAWMCPIKNEESKHTISYATTNTWSNRCCIMVIKECEWSLPYCIRFSEVVFHTKMSGLEIGTQVTVTGLSRHDDLLGRVIELVSIQVFSTRIERGINCPKREAVKHTIRVRSELLHLIHDYFKSKKYLKHTPKIITTTPTEISDQYQILSQQNQQYIGVMKRLCVVGWAFTIFLVVELWFSPTARVRELVWSWIRYRLGSMLLYRDTDLSWSVIRFILSLSIASTIMFTILKRDQLMNTYRRMKELYTLGQKKWWMNLTSIPRLVQISNSMKRGVWSDTSSFRLNAQYNDDGELVEVRTVEYATTIDRNAIDCKVDTVNMTIATFREFIERVLSHGLMMNHDVVRKSLSNIPIVTHDDLSTSDTVEFNGTQRLSSLGRLTCEQIQYIIEHHYSHGMFYVPPSSDKRKNEWLWYIPMNDIESKDRKICVASGYTSMDVSCVTIAFDALLNYKLYLSSASSMNEVTQRESLWGGFAPSPNPTREV